MERCLAILGLVAIITMAITLQIMSPETSIANSNGTELRITDLSTNLLVAQATTNDEEGLDDGKGGEAGLEERGYNRRWDGVKNG
ncbi:MAG: hypothetical protein ACP5VS_14430 [Desulfomonilaceae bacterium]